MINKIVENAISNRETNQLVSVVSISAAVIGISCFIGYTLSSVYWRDSLLKKGYAEYNSKTGKWGLCEPEVVLMNVYDPDIRSNSKGVTIKDYIDKADLEIKNLKNKIDDMDMVVKDQEKTLITYEKRLGITRKSNEIPEKSAQPTVKVN